MFTFYVVVFWESRPFDVNTVRIVTMSMRIALTFFSGLLVNKLHDFRFAVVDLNRKSGVVTDWEITGSKPEFIIRNLLFK